MTEKEWMEATDPTPILEFLRRRVSNRKLRLFAVACCRQVWGQLTDTARLAAETAERYADRAANRSEMAAAKRAVWTAFTTRSDGCDGWGGKQGAGWNAADWNNWTAATGAARSTRLLYPKPVAYLRLQAARRRTAGLTEASKRACRAEKKALAALQSRFVRDIFGNPFRPVTLDPSLITSTAIVLARRMYDSRDFSAMPILADALQDAGCADEAVLSHCRGEGPHVRGCWVVDLLLGKG